MRLWSVHPKYLDTKGLVALWREALLAKKVLENGTKGYRNHPQLNRFKNAVDSLSAINHYLCIVHEEALIRSYKFDGTKINWDFRKLSIPVTKGQVDYEIKHLMKKLQSRDRQRLKELKAVKIFEVHPVFTIVEGNVEDWEIV